jgi:hypothetical protein
MFQPNLKLGEARLVFVLWLPWSSLLLSLAGQAPTYLLRLVLRLFLHLKKESIYKVTSDLYKYISVITLVSMEIENTRLFFMMFYL